MKILRLILAELLRSSQVKVEISGFDVDGFSKAACWELGRRLDEIGAYAFDGSMTDGEKLAAIRACLERPSGRSTFLD